jgi:hypothetical protein
VKQRSKVSRAWDKYFKAKAMQEALALKFGVLELLRDGDEVTKISEHTYPSPVRQLQKIRDGSHEHGMQNVVKRARKRVTATRRKTDDD